jgi:hypothetical protein
MQRHCRQPSSEQFHTVAIHAKEEDFELTDLRSEVSRLQGEELSLREECDSA